VWLGTRRNLKGTHKCLNLDTLREQTGDVFRPTHFTQAAIERLNNLSENSKSEIDNSPTEVALENPNQPYALDPQRGVDTDKADVEDQQVRQEEMNDTDVIPAFETEIPHPQVAPTEQHMEKELHDTLIEKMSSYHRQTRSLRKNFSTSLIRTVMKVKLPGRKLPMMYATPLIRDTTSENQLKNNTFTLHLR
jgi:hypothetical protein